MKKVSRDDYLKALALFTMARHHSEEAERYNLVLAKMLGVDQYGHLADEIWRDAKPDFDAALEREEIEVAGKESADAAI